MRKSQKTSFIAVKSFWQFCRPYRLRIVSVMMVFAFSSALLAVMPPSIGHLIDALRSSPTERNAVWLWAGILVGLSVMHDIIWHIGEFSYRRFVNPIGYLYETNLFRSVIQKPYPYFVDKFTGKISSYITTLHQELRTLLEELCFSYTTAFINIVIIVVVLGSINWQTGLIFVVGLCAMFVFGRIVLRRTMAYQRLQTDVEATKKGQIIDAVANFSSIKAFRTEYKEALLVELAQTKTLASAQRSFLWIIFFWAVMGFCVRYLIWPATIVLNLHFYLANTITLGQFTTVLSTALIFTTTIWESVWFLSQFSLKMAKVDEAHEYLFGLEFPQPDTVREKMKKVPFKKTFSFKNITFAYPDKPDEFVLRNVSLTIKRAEKIGVVGRSGGGKSTLTKLLLDHYTLEDGSFSFDTTDVTAEIVAANIAFVPQDTTLFHRSIAENIAYAADNPKRSDIIRAAKMAEADGFIMKLDQGYDTLVGERGVKLSGGQRQRIAIARAMLQDAPILVLDEATSALDSESEQHIQKALQRLWRNKTVIAIAHRLSTLRHMDRIIVMDEGRIIEEGTHAELLEQNGTYAKLWAHQSGGFIDD